MNRTSIPTNKLRLNKVVACLAFGLAFVTAATVSASADDRQDHGRQGAEHHDNGKHGGHQDRDWNEHEGHAHHYWYRPYFQPEPEVVYAPPVVYSPPPVYEEPGFSLIFPLHIR
jgi:ABC-type Zn2+ transport system substrate-binding protein/surface adhesin